MRNTVHNRRGSYYVITWEIKLFRKVQKPATEQGVWGIRTDKELRNLKYDLGADFKMRRLEWLGLVTRTDQTRAAKKRFENIPESITKAGRPRPRRQVPPKRRQISTWIHGGPLIFIITDARTSNPMQRMICES
jgi:hypothetical protein